MKTILILWLAYLCLTACSDGQTEQASGTEPATEVTLTHPVRGCIPQETVLMATTSYQCKTTVTSPIASFVTDVQVKPGTRVQAGQILYRLESKEQHALGINENLIDITAERDGIVLDVQAQPGSYAAEGTTLCTLVDTASLVFEINVPYEQRAYARAGSRCTLELPDGAHLTATVQSPLAVMNTASQSERVVAIAEAPFLPEGMNVKAIFTSRNISAGITILPKSAVQSDETLAEHWVMRLAKDSTAAKVPVSIGNSTTDSIEILSPILSPRELIVATGSYGLTDGARVTIIHSRMEQG